MESNPQICVSGMGEYKCSVRVTVPEEMRQYYTKPVVVDKCLAQEIQNLLLMGVVTEASCCGHGDSSLASIIVADECVDRMISLGYEIAQILPQNVVVFKTKSALIYEQEGFDVSKIHELVTIISEGVSNACAGFVSKPENLL